MITITNNDKLLSANIAQSKSSDLITDKSQEIAKEVLSPSEPLVRKKDSELEKLVHDHLRKGDLPEALSAARAMSAGRTQGLACKKITEAALNQGDLSIAKAAVPYILYGRTALLEKIIDQEIANKQFVEAVTTCRSAFPMVSDSLGEKIAVAFTNSNPDLAEIEKVEHAILENEKKVPADVWASLHIILLKALSGLYLSLGHSEQAERLDKKIKSLQTCVDKWTSLWKTIKNLALGVIGPVTVLCAADALRFNWSPAPSLILGTTAALALYYPAARKPENLAGVATGVIASVAGGASPLKSLGVGVGTALALRIPLVKSAAVRGLEATDAVVTSAFLATLWGVGKTAEAIWYVGSKTVNGALSIGKPLANGAIKVSSFAYGCLGAIINEIDSAFDTVTLKK